MLITSINKFVWCKTILIYLSFKIQILKSEIINKNILSYKKKLIANLLKEVLLHFDFILKAKLFYRISKQDDTI